MENHSFRRAEVMPNQGVRLTLTVHPSGSPGAALGPGDVNRPNGLGGNSSNLAPPFTPVTSTGITPSPERQGRRNMQLGCRLFLDCMGHYSDVVKQMRGRAKPDGMCLVVGSCAEGFPTGNNTFGDLLYTIGNAQNDMQVRNGCGSGHGAKTRDANCVECTVLCSISMAVGLPSQPLPIPRVAEQVGLIYMCVCVCVCVCRCSGRRFPLRTAGLVLPTCSHTGTPPKHRPAKPFTGQL